jgi:hypothetical protein
MIYLLGKVIFLLINEYLNIISQPGNAKTNSRKN